MLRDASIHSVHSTQRHHLSELHATIHRQTLSETYLVITQHRTFQPSDVFQHHISSHIIHSFFTGIFLHLQSCQDMVHSWEIVSERMMILVSTIDLIGRFFQHLGCHILISLFLIKRYIGSPHHLLLRIFQHRPYCRYLCITIWTWCLYLQKQSQHLPLLSSQFSYKQQFTQTLHTPILLHIFHNPLHLLLIQKRQLFQILLPHLIDVEGVCIQLLQLLHQILVHHLFFLSHQFHKIFPRHCSIFPLRLAKRSVRHTPYI